MTEPKKDIYNILKTIKDVNVYQARPELVIEYPCITFFVNSNVPAYVLEKGIGFQSIEVTIDIYTEKSSESGSLLHSLEEVMLNNGYRLTFCSDIPNDDNSHITTVFNLVGY